MAQRLVRASKDQGGRDPDYAYRPTTCCPDRPPAVLAVVTDLHTRIAATADPRELTTEALRLGRSLAE